MVHFVFFENVKVQIDMADITKTVANYNKIEFKFSNLNSTSYFLLLFSSYCLLRDVL